MIETDIYTDSSMAAGRVSTEPPVKMSDEAIAEFRRQWRLLYEESYPATSSKAHPCEMCGCETAELQTDPFLLEIHGDDTPRWLCEECCQQRRDDI